MYLFAIHYIVWFNYQFYVENNEKCGKIVVLKEVNMSKAKRVIEEYNQNKQEYLDNLKKEKTFSGRLKKITKYSN